MKITGIKKSVGRYNKLNHGGIYSGHYGSLILNRATGELWVDEFFDIGHNTYRDYDDQAIIDLVRWADQEYGDPFDNEVVKVTMKNVKEWAGKACALYAEKKI